MKENLGIGKFGIVKAALHKISGKRVAVKILNKLKMASKVQEIVRKEIEVLKFCQHPNIIRLLDIFENGEYIFIGKTGM